MAVLSGKKILLGVTGGIAAYKATFLVRLFIKKGAEVRVVMTQEARDFVTPLTLSTLSKNPVVSSFTEDEAEGTWNNHVELGKWADVMCVAPMTANTLAKMVRGQSDNMLLATYLSTDCPVFVAPAMDLDMYQHPTTKENLSKLKKQGVQIVPAASGELASGLVGEGRMAEPETIITFLENALKQELSLYGKKVLITAGPTYEAIDPVRFIGNHSSGKMGYALAACAAKNGAEVTLISGPTALQNPFSEINLIRVTSAKEMYMAVHSCFEEADIVIAAAAVADYRPEQVAPQKVKKKDASLILKLEKTEDILESLGKEKTHQFIVGFALETENELKNARKKLVAKNLDFVVLNSLRDKGAGFQTDTNKVQIISAETVIDFKVKSKEEVASDIIKEISRRSGETEK